MTHPADKLIAALPGTVADLAAATGYKQDAVYMLILSARRQGRRIVCVPNPGALATFALTTEDSNATVAAYAAADEG